MQNTLTPAVWLLVLIAGLPQFSETVYSPALPEISRALNTSVSMVEYTLTIYLFGMGIGTVFWGKLSDKIGRKPCVISGFVVFILACLACYFSTTIQMLMLSRFIQAFGGSVSSVIGQAMCRDSFTGPALGRVYSSIGSSIAVFPAIGPIIGGIVSEKFGWSNIFILLFFCALMLTIITYKILPETLPKSKRTSVSSMEVGKKLVTDKKVIAYGLIIAGGNGMIFSYYAEGPFYLIEKLGLSPSQYGLSFLFIALSTMCGGLFSKYLHSFHDSKTILNLGLKILILNEVIFSFLITLNYFKNLVSIFLLIALTVVMHMSRMFAICMVNSNALTLSLVDYKFAIGTASSLLGLFFYVLISLFTFGMGRLHNGSLLTMPLYFLGITIFVTIVNQKLLKDKIIDL